jgi:hypothetical protein
MARAPNTETDVGTAWTVCAGKLQRWRINGEMLEMEIRTTTVGRWHPGHSVPVAGIRACFEAMAAGLRACASEAYANLFDQTVADQKYAGPGEYFKGVNDGLREAAHLIRGHPDGQ